MLRTIGKLTALKIERAMQPGMYGDGGGLYLRVTETGAKNWVFRFMLNGRARWMGMGPLHTVSLAEARRRACEHRLRRHDGVDPIEARRQARLRARIDAAKSITFKECGEGFLKAHRAGWRNAKHAAQWEATLATYVYPIIGALPVHAIDTEFVLKVLEQEVRDAPDQEPASLWTAKNETANRVRMRIEAILNWARVRHGFDRENPARWRGHLDKSLPAPSKVRKVEHHAALPHDELPEFFTELRAQESIGARALEFAILTAARTAEVIGARWSEFNFNDKTWTIPSERMKARRVHRVPLSDLVLAILEKMRELRHSDDAFVFPGGKRGKPMSNMAMTMTLRRLKRADLTVHGFRSTFRDWAAERTEFANEVVEMALAHAVGDKVEAAYRRGDLFEKRRKLMKAWADFCMKPATGTANVVSIAGARQ